ncbi:hypothetical protein WME90_37290 [Sorangium sp. So ce375]|uniref:hypothetical protein n=1 Tax=Sorangium sp. So ce375 TaxID=3133306 RepID=UPI003F5BF520
MTWRTAIALAALLQAGCLGTRDDDASCQRESSRPLEAGEQVNGHDPVELLTPYAGRWHGTVTWRDGQVTDIDIDIDSPSDPASSLQADMYCDRARRVYAWLQAAVSTADGALDDWTWLDASVRFLDDGTPVQEEPDLAGFSNPFGPPASTFVARDRYQNPHIVIELTWNTPTLPATGRLLFFGQPEGITGLDEIELGTIVF